MSTELNTQREALIALVNPVSGKDEEFRTWYWGTHIPEVLALPGFVSAQCHRLAEETGPLSPFQYATVYEVEGSALAARDRLFSSGVGMSDVIDLTNMITSPFLVPLTVLPSDN